MDLKLTVFILSVLFCATWAAQVHVGQVPASEAQEIIYYEDDSDDTVMPPYEPGRERSSTDPLNVCSAPKQKQRKSLSSSEKLKKTTNIFFESGDSLTIDRSDSVESNRPFALCRSRSRTYSFCDSCEEGTVLTPETFSDFPVAGPRLLARRPSGLHRSSSGRNPSIDSIPEAATEDD